MAQFCPYLKWNNPLQCSTLILSFDLRWLSSLQSVVMSFDKLIICSFIFYCVFCCAGAVPMKDELSFLGPTISHANYNHLSPKSQSALINGSINSTLKFLPNYYLELFKSNLSSQSWNKTYHQIVFHEANQDDQVVFKTKFFHIRSKRAATARADRLWITEWFLMRLKQISAVNDMKHD